jgi:DNA-binding MarR family transcriptional regulator
MMVHNMELPEGVREMGESQMLVLHSLIRGRQLTSDLAEHFNVTNPTMTRIIDGLVDKGYVERHHAMGDRRCIFLQLTGQGQDMGKRVEQHFRNAIIQFLRPLTEEQLIDIVKAYRHLESLLPDGSLDAEDATMKEDHRSKRAERAHRSEAMRHHRIGRRGHLNHIQLKIED